MHDPSFSHMDLFIGPDTHGAVIGRALIEAVHNKAAETASRRNEALDTLTYSYAARGLVGLDLERRADDLASVSGPQKRSKVARSKWLDG